MPFVKSRRPMFRFRPSGPCVLCRFFLRHRPAALLPFVLALTTAHPVRAGVQYSFSFDVPLVAQAGNPPGIPDLPDTTFLFSGKFFDTDVNNITQQVSTFEDLSLTVADFTLSGLFPFPSSPTLDLTGVVLPPAAGTSHPSILGPNTEFDFAGNVFTEIRFINVLDTHIHREYSAGTIAGHQNIQDVMYSDASISITNLSPLNTTVPEPSSLTLWSSVVVLAWGLRSRLKKSPQPRTDVSMT
jgi:hypothetical protein